MTLLNTKQVPLEFQVEQKKFKKYHKIKYKNTVSSLSRKISGGISLVSHDHLYVYVKRIVSALKIVKPSMKLIKTVKKEGKRKRCLLAFEPNMDTILTKKPKDIRMGRGKGVPSDKVNAYRGGSNLFALYNLSSAKAKKILLSCSKKFSSKNNIILTAEW